MKILDWLTNRFSDRGKAVSLYKQGMAKAKKHDHLGALADYTTVIGMPGAPADLLAMVLYNRALVYVAQGDELRGSADLAKVLAMNDGIENVKSMARQKLARMKFRADRTHG